MSGEAIEKIYDRAYWRITRTSGKGYSEVTGEYEDWDPVDGARKPYPPKPHPHARLDPNCDAMNDAVWLIFVGSLADIEDLLTAYGELVIHPADHYEKKRGERRPRIEIYDTWRE